MPSNSVSSCLRIVRVSCAWSVISDRSVIYVGAIRFQDACCVCAWLRWRDRVVRTQFDDMYNITPFHPPNPNVLYGLCTDRIPHFYLLYLPRRHLQVPLGPNHPEIAFATTIPIWDKVLLRLREPPSPRLLSTFSGSPSSHQHINLEFSRSLTISSG